MELKHSHQKKKKKVEGMDVLLNQMGEVISHIIAVVAKG